MGNISKRGSRGWVSPPSTQELKRGQFYGGSFSQGTKGDKPINKGVDTIIRTR